MSGGACKSCADQANDAIAYVEGLRKPAGKAGCGAKAKPTQRKKGCQKQGPGCENAACNACADQAVAAIDYAAALPSGFKVVTMGRFGGRGLRGGAETGGPAHGWLGGGLDLNPHAGGQPPGTFQRELIGCDTIEASAMCDSSKGEFLISAGPWIWAQGGCYRPVVCGDSAAMCGPGDAQNQSDAVAECQTREKPCSSAKFDHWSYHAPATDGEPGTCWGVWRCYSGAKCEGGLTDGYYYRDATLATPEGLATRFQVCRGCASPVDSAWELNQPEEEVSISRDSHASLSWRGRYDPAKKCENVYSPDDADDWAECQAECDAKGQAYSPPRQMYVMSCAEPPALVPVGTPGASPCVKTVQCSSFRTHQWPYPDP